MESFSEKSSGILIATFLLVIVLLAGTLVGFTEANDSNTSSVENINLTATQNGSTMNVELISAGKPNGSFTDMAIIFIPEQQYNKITVIGNNAGVSLPPLNANINMTSNKGAMSIRVPKVFNKTIDFTSTSGSGSLVLSSLADNYTLNMTGKNSAISVSPELPKYTFQPQYKYVMGNGKAAINLNIAKSSCG